MISMTGFGYCEKSDGITNVSVEIKSYNNRYLDLFVNLPPFISPVEPRLRSFLTDRIARGRVEIYVKYKALEEDLDIHLDRRALEAYLQILGKMAEYPGVDKSIRVSDLLPLEGILKVEKSKDLDEVFAKILPVLEEAFAIYLASKEEEGRKTEEDILSQLAVIKQGASFIETKVSVLEKMIGDNIREKIRQFSDQDFDENRILTETALLLMKYTIGEEIARLAAHTSSFEEIMKEKAVSKKLDFLCQEIGREINTIGSKSPLVEVNQKVVDLKDALEKIREQLRNVE